MIEAPNSVSLNITSSEVTVEGWVYSEDVNPRGGIAIKSNVQTLMAVDMDFCGLV